MPSNEDWNSSFEELARSLGGLVGENEIQAREYFGNEQYDKILAMIDVTNALMLQKEVAQIRYLNAISFLHKSIALLVGLAIPLSLAWSLYCWL